MKYNHLLGREFIHGKQDCYTMVRDFYRDNFGMSLRNYARPNLWWQQPNITLYSSLYSKEGFRAINVHPTDWRPADLLLMSIKSSSPNHIGIIVDDGSFIHHLYGRLSSKESAVQQVAQFFGWSVAPP